MLEYSPNNSPPTKSEHLRLAILIVAAVLGCIALGLFLIDYHFKHRGEGPHHIFPLPGNAILTDDQAIAFGKETLNLDGRFSASMQLDEFGDDRNVSRGDDKTYTTVAWRYPGTNDVWYVQIHRTPDQVDAVSSPGK
jgi:hypothetical protein